MEAGSRVKTRRSVMAPVPPEERQVPLRVVLGVLGGKTQEVDYLSRDHYDPRTKNSNLYDFDHDLQFWRRCATRSPRWARMGPNRPQS